MALIPFLIFLGILFLVAELVLLPGLSIGGLLSLVCYGSALYVAFADYGAGVGLLTLAAILLLSLAAVVLSLRAKTWQRFSLDQKINSSSSPLPAQQEIRIGDRGITVSRLSPMGRVEIKGKSFEAKSADAYVDPKREIEVVGFENSNVIVKPIK